MSVLRKHMNNIKLTSMAGVNFNFLEISKIFSLNVQDCQGQHKISYFQQQNFFINPLLPAHDLHDGQHPVPPPLCLDDGDPPVIDDGVPIYGEDGGVPVPDPGHGVVPDLVDPAGQVGDVPHPDGDVPGCVPGEVGTGVQP